MFKILVLQAQHNLSDARMEFMIRDGLSWMRFMVSPWATAPPMRTPSATSATA